MNGHASTSSARRSVYRPAARRRSVKPWPTEIADFIPQRSSSSLLSVGHLSAVARAAYYGLMAITAVTVLFLLPTFLIYLTGLQSIARTGGLIAATISLAALMFSMALSLLQIVLVLKLPEQIAWVRTLLTGVLVLAGAEAVMRDWLYPSVIGLGFRWDLLIAGAMVLLLWLPQAGPWHRGESPTHS
ncbi:MAG: hypothetical protein Q4F53_05795 [Nesterenkonia sp.]|uniref:hypothetical protein n=1 Tax=Nesterenkonia marinintestina TaxID=2979865 RepID=UPI0021C0D23C|nr:hypothetical protein [Nesterenkonia sp. GX14115]MDO5493109.1 hypothetical protein [Nesterenkonia sp.]